mmetsp:Transcript_75787/g.149825  ORF Transcript_75787/g.149825 Transcript_75787/m.149825 type:complete len:270 (-) Transcript_75787:274-1083(-)
MAPHPFLDQLTCAHGHVLDQDWRGVPQDAGGLLNERRHLVHCLGSSRRCSDPCGNLFHNPWLISRIEAFRCPKFWCDHESHHLGHIWCVKPDHLSNDELPNVSLDQFVWIVLVLRELLHDIRGEWLWKASVRKCLRHPTNLGHVLCRSQREVLDHRFRNLITHSGSSHVPADHSQPACPCTQDQRHDIRNALVVNQFSVVWLYEFAVRIPVVFFEELAGLASLQCRNPVHVCNIRQVICGEKVVVGHIKQKPRLVEHLLFAFTSTAAHC